jgi:general secretion pathway protein D
VTLTTMKRTRPPAQSRGIATRLVVLATSLVTLAGGAVSVQAQDAQQISPNFVNTDIRVITQAVMELTGRNVIIAPQVNAQVTMYSNTPVGPDEFYSMFLAALAVHDLSAIESEDVVRVVPFANARQFASDDNPPEPGDAFVTRTILVQNVSAAQIVPILRPLSPQTAHLVAHPESNVLILADRAANVERLAEIVRRLDRAGNSDVEFIPLENASAGEVVATLNSLAQGTQAAAGAPTAQFIADTRTNSILLSGSETARLRYRAAIVYLDTPLAANTSTEVRYLQYALATELAPNLLAQFGGTAAAEGQPATAGEEGVTIWADEGTNALVINAPPTIKQDIMSVIDQIDIRRAQVQVDAIIVELSDEKAAELGVTWISTGDNDNEVVGLTNFGVTAGVVDLANAAQGTAPDAGALPEGITLGVGRITDSGTSWAAVVSALRGDANTNIISTQTIVALDNEEAEIRVGQEVPFLTGQFTNTGAAAGSVNPFQTIQREEVGTSLRITPQINDGSGVRLTIEQETSGINQGAGGAVDLITNSRTITTVAFVEDQQILVLGGLVDDTLLQSEQRVPGLGRIPGLGWLFRARKTERVRQNLFVFIRPTILRDGIDATMHTNAKYDYIRELQRQQAEERVRLMRNETIPVLPEAAELARPPDSPEDVIGEDSLEDGDAE